MIIFYIVKRVSQTDFGKYILTLNVMPTTGLKQVGAAATKD